MLLTTKLSESPRRIRDVVRVVANYTRASHAKAFKPLDLDSAEYSEARDGVTDAEAKILTKLAFEVHVEHPHGFLVNYLASMGLVQVPGLAQVRFCSP